MASPTASAIFGKNFVDVGNQALALNLSTSTASAFKYALFDQNIATPDFSTDPGNYGVGASWLTTHEMPTIGSYVQGGFDLVTPTYVVNTAVSGARMLWKNANPSQAITGFTGTPYCGMAYRYHLVSTTNYGIVYHYFGAVPVVGGTLTITWHATYAAGTLLYTPFV
jgi:hypothetical protein